MEIIEEAKGFPNGYVYEIDNSYGPFDESSHVPPNAIIGAWKVDGAGVIVGGFIPNENYDGPVQSPLPPGVRVNTPRSKSG